MYTENLAPLEERRGKGAEFSHLAWTALASRAVDGPRAFDVRSCGHESLSPLIRSRADLFEMRDDQTQGGLALIYVRLRS